MEFVDDEFFDTGGYGAARRELCCPECLCRNQVRLRSGGSRLEITADDVGIDDETAAHEAVQRLGRAGPWVDSRVDVPLSVLAAREDIGAVDLFVLRVPDAVHVRTASQLPVITRGAAFPDT